MVQRQKIGAVMVVGGGVGGMRAAVDLADSGYKVYLVVILPAIGGIVVTINSEDTVFDAYKKYRDCKVGCLVVKDKERCVGIVTERDLIERTIHINREDEKIYINPKKTKIKETKMV